MLVCRYTDAGRYGYGRIDSGSGGTHLSPVRYDTAARSWVPAGGPSRPLSDVTLLAPAEPTKIVCLALNWAAGDRPTGGPLPRAADSAVLLKPSTSLIGPDSAVVHPGPDWELRHEAELAVVIGVRCSRVSAARAPDVIAGYTAANDITAYARRTPQNADRQPVWAKHFDGCTPLGPWLATGLDPADVVLSCRVDGELRQQAGTRDLVVPVADVVALVSEHMTLLPGDVVLTGTPPGSGPLPAGSRVEVSATGIGVLRTTVDAPSRPGERRTAAALSTSLDGKGRCHR
ncbi:fumarylacetoacetate hydrolase family protein [Actinoplanes flavus]|uniref:Fumarylacetoacetate hydrolase family protein n=1 Tax=Actinoplanes flavus TaxID=2820290 RepID=A0ABS3US17_9ACTN|nr:fumarylacetoacetate hydrolase family protein [Actinoplanes flavus]MBO3741332.1 fumarylacetoacetate hydrolase family protein [Actinoplanes flavus]